MRLLRLAARRTSATSPRFASSPRRAHGAAWARTARGRPTCSRRSTSSPRCGRCGPPRWPSWSASAQPRARGGGRLRRRRAACARLSVEVVRRRAHRPPRRQARQDRLDDYFEGLAAVSFTPGRPAAGEGRARRGAAASSTGPPSTAGRRCSPRRATTCGPCARATRALRAARPRDGGGRASGTPLVRAGRAGCSGAARRSSPSSRRGWRAAFARDLRRRARRAARLAYRAAGGLRARRAARRELAEAAREALAARLARDLERGYTSRRAARGRPAPRRSAGTGARAYGSQGQQRALVLALKIAEIENLRAALGRPPLLLLDDVSSELDPAEERLPARLPRGAARRRPS